MASRLSGPPGTTLAAPLSPGLLSVKLYAVPTARLGSIGTPPGPDPTWKLKQPGQPSTWNEPITAGNVPVMPVPVTFTVSPGETPVRFRANGSPPTILNPSIW